MDWVSETCSFTFRQDVMRLWDDAPGLAKLLHVFTWVQGWGNILLNLDQSGCFAPDSTDVPLFVLSVFSVGLDQWANKWRHFTCLLI